MCYEREKGGKKPTFKNIIIKGNRYITNVRFNGKQWRRSFSGTFGLYSALEYTKLLKELIKTVKQNGDVLPPAPPPPNPTVKQIAKLEEQLASIPWTDKLDEAFYQQYGADYPRWIREFFDDEVKQGINIEDAAIIKNADKRQKLVEEIELLKAKTKTTRCCLAKN